ncbi:FG-GAP repeat protein [Streptomyces malaysiensis subsp. malaysiensis]|uniref:FG-GAP and VCBS repeat-containing protein n=1 Tax=Streptomyces malaysiensis TaxID=92644 RepID=UPI000CA2C313|nr:MULTISPECIES: VCBS repeat-containing protein [unclassified Streptomyces]AUA16187.1 FG-GAP repeat protein [Streptomyces sp. M56]
MASPTTRLRPVTAALCATALALLTACGGGGGDDGKKGGDGAGKSTASPVVTPTATAPVPRGEGSALPDDLNGDGRPELRIPLASDEELGGLRHIAFVYGSAKGLDPAVRTVLGRTDLGLPTGAGWDDRVAGEMRSATTADLDGDGYADVIATATKERDPASAGRVHITTQTLPYITWGSPEGPRRGAPATPVGLADADDGLESPWPLTTGDFNGDGHHDLAAVRQGGKDFHVLYGPFGRDGKAAHTETYANPLGPSGQIAELHADAIDGDRPTDLVVHAQGDDDQTESALLTAGPDGLATTGRTLRKGNAIAFGDFDGDGKRDVAVADTGSRNDEPGYETEPADVSQSVSVYTERSAGSDPRPIRIPALGGDALAAADTDGDGTDELAVSLRTGGTELLTIRPDAPGEIAHRRTLDRTVPARVDGHEVPKKRRAVRLHGAGDFDHDGKDEVVLAWGPDPLFALYGEKPQRFWVTDGAADEVVFTSAPYAKGAS